jgi:flagellar hook-associated protein 1 FlgK
MTTGSLFTQLDMGKRSLMAQQAGMSTAGHNIANIDNEDYSRQRVDLDPQHPFRSRLGAGVDIIAVERMTDQFLNKRLIAEQSRGGNVEIREQGLRRVEALFAEVEGFGLRNALNDFWAAWGRLSTAPETEIYRQDLLNSGDRLAQRIQGMHKDFVSMRKELNGRIAERVERVNQLAGEIASLNKQIQQTDRNRGEANDLRDKRDGALKQLSKIIQIDWFENDSKQMMVSIGGGFPLVHGRSVNPVEASYDSEETGFFSLKGIDPKGISRVLTPQVQAGELKEFMILRDEILVGFINKLDELSSEVAYRVNRFHNSGTGLNATFDKLTSSFALKPDALNRPLPFLKDGTLQIHLVGEKYDLLETYEIELRAGQDTVFDVVNRINATVANPNLLRARVNDDGSVTLESQGPHNFVLGRDETDFSTLMGFNNFFENLEGARDFRINDRLKTRPNLISTGTGLLPGDNSIALEINQLQFAPTMSGESITFDEYYNGLLAQLGLMINRASEEVRNQRLVLDQFQRLRDEISSVNMDEEVANMVQFQRGFEAASKFISTVDEMTQTIIDM